jgi:NitT/TauT family transport system substrate-binding protein
MRLTRRGMIAGGSAAVSALGAPSPALSQPTRSLSVSLLGYALGIHVPTTAALMDLLPGVPGYGAPKVARMDQMRTVAQTVIGGAAELGESDPIVSISAVEAGADLKIVGLWYAQTSLVLVVQSDRIKEYKDLVNPANVVAVNERGDITHVAFLGPLLRAGIDINKINLVDIGGSGARMRALMSGRVQAVPMHFDQAAEVTKTGKFHVLIEPYKEYRAWINEVWITTGAWLGKKENERALVDLLKVNLIAFRRANTDLAWFSDAYRRHATVPDVAKASDESIRPLWDGLAHSVKAWPPNGGLDAADIEELIPLYKAAGAVQGKLKASSLVVTDYLHQAVSELS